MSIDSALLDVIGYLNDAQSELEDIPEDEFEDQVIVDIHWEISDAIDSLKKARQYHKSKVNLND